MKILIYIQNTKELWECESDYPLEKGEIFCLNIFDEKGDCEKEMWLKVVNFKKNIKNEMTKYNTKIANVPWAKN